MEDLRNRSLGELVAEASRDLSSLVQNEIALARMEIGGMVAKAMRHAALVAIGGALCFAGLLVLLAGAVLAGIALGLPPLASALIVAVLLLAVGGLLTQRALAALRQSDFVPRETIRTVKETAELVTRRS